jgi:hypothetical protein
VFCHTSSAETAADDRSTNTKRESVELVTERGKAGFTPTGVDGSDDGVNRPLIEYFMTSWKLGQVSLSINRSCRRDSRKYWSLLSL